MPANSRPTDALANRILLVAAFILVSVPTMPIAAPVENHPLIEPYAGSSLTRREDAGHSTYKFVTSVNPSGKTDDEALPTSSATGDLTRLFYENPASRSQAEILANYKEALAKANFEILFECGADACGPGWASSRWGRVTGMKYVSNPLWYLCARRAGDGGSTAEAFVAVSVMKARHQVDVLVTKSMDTGLVSISAEALQRGIENEGRVVLDGLFFDHNKSVLKPESKPALEVIATFLKSNAQLNVYIVGHTDATGGFEENMALSQSRAAAVVTALTQEHKIAGKRLAAHGVGPLCPARTNGTDAGKAKNRRVEMVAK